MTTKKRNKILSKRGFASPGTVSEGLQSYLDWRGLSPGENAQNVKTGARFLRNHVRRAPRTEFEDDEVSE